MNCKLVRENIVDVFAAGADSLSPSALLHMQSCVRCREFHVAQASLFRAIDSGLSHTMHAPVPVSLLPGLRARMESTHPVRIWRLALMPAAAAILLAYFVAPHHLHRTAEVQQAVATPTLHESPGVTGKNNAVAESIPQLIVPNRLIRRAPAKSLGSQLPRFAAAAGVSEILVGSEEKLALARFARAVREQPQLGQAILHPTELPAPTLAQIKPLEIADLDIPRLSEEDR